MTIGRNRVELVDGAVILWQRWACVEMEELGSEPHGYTGSDFADEVVELVWEAGAVVQGNDPALWRKDFFGAWIYRLDYRSARSEFGWRIADLSGTGEVARLPNLRPFQWENHRDLFLARRESRIRADGLRNARFIT